MQSVILAADRGTGMEPLSSITPKPMLPVLDRPIVAHVADAAIAGGTDELVFVVDERFQHIRSYFGSRYGDVPVTYVTPDGHRGTAAAVRAARHHIDDRFAVLEGDSLLDPESVVALFEEPAAVACHRVDEPREYGVVSTEGRTAIGVVEKPAESLTDLANAGAYVFPAWARDELDVQPNKQGSEDLTDVLARVIHRERVGVVPTVRWRDMTRPADLLAANQVVLDERPAMIEGPVHESASVDGPVHVAPGATIGASVTLDGPLYIGADATIAAGATVGPSTVVCAGATVGESARLEDCLVFPGASTGTDVDLRNVVVGPNCTLSAGSAIAGVIDEADGGTAAVVTDGRPLEGGLDY